MVNFVKITNILHNTVLAIELLFMCTIKMKDILKLY